MALINKLNDIADAIRRKTGKSDLLTLDNMVTEIDGIQVGGSSTIPAFIAGTATKMYDHDILAVREYAFYGAQGTDTLDFVNFGNVKTIGQYAFYHQTKLTSFNLTLTETIGQYAFCYNLKLQSFSLPSIVSIGNYAFFTNDVAANATALTKIDLGANLTSIGSSAFCYNQKLETIIIRATTPPTLSNSNAFTNTVTSSGGYIYVPAAALDAYKSATNWSTYKNYMRAIEDYPDICGEVV